MLLLKRSVIYITMIFVFCPSNGFSQEQAPEVELCFQTFNSTSTKFTKFVLYEVPNSNSPIRLSGTYANLATVCAHSAIAPRNYSTKDISILGNSLCIENGFEYRFANEDDINYQTDCETIHGFRSGQYRIDIYVNDIFKTYLYYDNRNSSFPGNSCNYLNEFSNDITVRYDVGNNKIYYIDELTDQTDLSGFTELNMGLALNWWEVNNASVDLTSYINRNFAVLTEPARVGNSPQLVWNKPVYSEYFYSYEIQRSWLPNDFIAIYETYDYADTIYQDSEVFWHQNPAMNIQPVQYRIVTKYEHTTYTQNEYSNIQKIMVDDDLAKKSVVKEKRANITLGEVYPNPGNDIVNIPLSCTENIRISIELYNPLGELVKEFGTKEYSTGEHYLKVDCGDLRPGVYFYKLIAGSEKYFSRFVIAR